MNNALVMREQFTGQKLSIFEFAHGTRMNIFELSDHAQMQNYEKKRVLRDHA
jgi:hypothetical protein